MSVRFDNAADRLLRTSSLIDHNAPYTWIGWIYLVSDLNATSVFFATDDDTINNADLIRTSTDGTTLQSRVSVAAAQTQANGTNLSIGVWYHVAVVRESVTSLKIYLNGVLDSTNTRDVTGRGAVTRIEHGAVLSTNTQRSDSRCDAIKIWSTNLTQDEILAEMWSIRPQRTANLYGFYPTFTGSDRVTDYSGNGRNWTESGTLTDEDRPSISWFAQSQRIILPNPVVGGTTYTKTGSAISVFVGSGVKQRIATKTGSAVLNCVASGTRQRTATRAGSSILNSVGSGTKQREATRIGTAVLNSVGSGTRQRTATRIGTGRIDSIVGSGTKSRTVTRLGSGVLGSVGSGAKSRTASRIGTGVLSAVGSGRYAKTYTKVGSGVMVLVGSGIFTPTVPFLVMPTKVTLINDGETSIDLITN